jgi:methylmalonyl-CoA/ethylmalonyl-CoA epimerase
MVKRIAHIGIATKSLIEAARFYELLGLEMGTVELHRDQKVRAALLGVGESALELLEGTDEESPVTRFIKNRGEGIHHITFEVEDIRGEIKKLLDADVQMINESPIRGVDGSLVAFVHPSSTCGVLVELLQPVEGDD